MVEAVAMVGVMDVLGVAASAKLAGDRMVRDVVGYLQEVRGGIVMPSATSGFNLRDRGRGRRVRRDRLSRPFKPGRTGLGSRPGRGESRVSRKIGAMTDEELEAELENRRRRRTKEKELYTRAMRADKLSALESELNSLRREIGRMEGHRPARPNHAGTPAIAKWGSLPRSRRVSADLGNASLSRSSSLDYQASSVTSPATSAVARAPVRAPGGPPPPPPPMPRRGVDDEDDELEIDPEKQKREKAERQRRREAKKKEREQTQKKLTLADIIRSAGADPSKRLKPASKKPADLEQEEWERAKKEREEREHAQELERIEKERLDKEGATVKPDDTNRQPKSEGKKAGGPEAAPVIPSSEPSHEVVTEQSDVATAESDSSPAAETTTTSPQKVLETATAVSEKAASTREAAMGNADQETMSSANDTSTNEHGLASEATASPSQPLPQSANTEKQVSLELPPLPPKPNTKRGAPVIPNDENVTPNTPTEGEPPGALAVGASVDAVELQSPMSATFEKSASE